MKVKFIKVNSDFIPKGIVGESIIYEFPNEYITGKPSSKYMVNCFKCGIVASISEHNVQIVDGIVTLAPSLVCPKEGCTAHYYIKNGLVC